MNVVTLMLRALCDLHDALASANAMLALLAAYLPL